MKKIEYYVNLLFYSILLFLRQGTHIFDHCIYRPIDAFFSKFVPKWYHPIGIKHPELRREWNERSDRSFASIATFMVLTLNTFLVSLLVFSTTNIIIGIKCEIVLIISAISASSWLYFMYIFIDKNDKYVNYFHIFEQKSKRWKRVCMILAFLICFESLLWPLGFGYSLYVFDY